MNNDEIRLRPDEIRTRPETIRADDELSPVEERWIQIVASILALIPLYFLGRWLHSVIDQPISDFIHWLGWFSFER